MCEDSIYKIITGELVDEVTRLPDKKFVEKFLKDKKDLWILEVHVEFKGLNDGYKDIAISKVSSVLKHSVRLPRDMVARVGERDFLIMMAGVDESVVKTVAERIKANLDYMSMGFGNNRIEIKSQVSYRYWEGS